ncbi:hypothetical protein [Glycomyces sp. NPDC021274]|uniref:hypothetical protein n=1 Tax=Glycomyces sp. NPDC021274 TaxID=3155120 RepID=UPI0033D3268A
MTSPKVRQFARRGAALVGSFIVAAGLGLAVAAPAEAGAVAWSKGGCTTAGSSTSTKITTGPYSGSCGFGYGAAGYTGSTLKCSNGGQHSGSCTSSGMTKGYHTTPIGSGYSYV